jgi:hypothetical protein
MVTQILFGEVVEILQNHENTWDLVRCAWDGYMGWVSSNQLTRISEKEYNSYRESKEVCAEVLAPAMSDGDSRYIPFGATLPGFDEMSFKVMGKHFSFGGWVTFPERLEHPHAYICKMAMRLLHVPYLWGGRSSGGIDCSGFVQVLYKHLGISVPRDAYQQVEVGRDVDFASSAQSGDLAFFRTAYSSRISHVGLVLMRGQIIHASGQVRVDKLDHYGIYNQAEGKYTHLLVGIKRILQDL